MNPTFIKYEANETPEAQRGAYDPIGIATIGVFNNAIVLRYTLKPGQNGKGFYVSEFSQKLNGQWNKSHTINFNVDKEEIEALIKKNINAPQKPIPSEYGNTGPLKEAPQKTYTQPSFGNSECPF